MYNGLLYARSYPISEKIQIVIPTLRQILAKEDAYYNMVTTIVATPYELMVQLEDAGIDFTTISDFELFLLLFSTLRQTDASLIFGDLDLTQFQTVRDKKTGAVYLLDRRHDIKIDRRIHSEICAVLRKIHYLERNYRTPGNLEAQKYMLERARIKQKRAAKQKKSQLEELIIAMVNTEQFSYGYEDVLDLTIYQFQASVHQIIKKINYDNVMIGCYAGTVNIKELNQDELNWLSQN